MNIAELALKSLEVGEHVSYIFEGREITNVQMDRSARKFGNALTALGVSRGDRVIMQMQNCPEVFKAFQAIWRLGAIALPINYLVGQEEINYIDKIYGEELKAFVTLKAGQTATAGEILEYCRGKLKKFFVPKEVVILAAMPKTLVGKILKKELRKM